MSKTFKSAVSHREVRIWPTDAGFAIAVLDDVLNDSMSTQLTPSDAPTLALAILEAAGHDADIDDASSLVNSAMGRLAMHVTTEATKAKESADREALEGEARILFDAGTDYLNGVSVAKRKSPAWGEVSDNVRAAYLMVARKARELHGGTR